MLTIERLRTANRHAYAVKRQGIVAADAFQDTMGRAARAHIILGMHLKETLQKSFGFDGEQMLMLQACAGETSDRMHRKAEAPLWARVPDACDCVQLRLRSPSRYPIKSESGSENRVRRQGPRCSRTCLPGRTSRNWLGSRWSKCPGR